MTATPEGTDSPTAGGVRRRYCLCSRADRMNGRSRSNCPLHGISLEAVAYRDGLADADPTTPPGVSP